MTAVISYIMLLISVSLPVPAFPCIDAADKQSKKNAAVTAEEEVDHLRNWQDVYSSSDKAFFTSVLRHIDATCDTDNLREIISNVANNHTSKNKRMCTSIRKAATEALQEQK